MVASDGKHRWMPNWYQSTIIVDDSDWLLEISNPDPCSDARSYTIDLPQVAEINPPLPMDAAGEGLLYDELNMDEQKGDQP
jgi:hypothetical protein